ncbi:hypothetical protein BJ742DRAFT_852852 [Cladochytrium replicatum]|nr:hypothetical protein BJ742DRAFT_852852 [Cladochytrium replicatum]
MHLHAATILLAVRVASFVISASVSLPGDISPRFSFGIEDFESCIPGESSCTNTGSECCIATADKHTRKHTCRPVGGDCDEISYPMHSNQKTSTYEPQDQNGLHNYDDSDFSAEIFEDFNDEDYSTEYSLDNYNAYLAHYNHKRWTGKGSCACAERKFHHVDGRKQASEEVGGGIMAAGAASAAQRMRTMQPSEEHAATLMAVGFEREAVVGALTAANNNMEQAATFA